MDRNEIIELARRAENGEAKALREFRTLALANGFHGQRGGWIYHEREPGFSIVQGWQGLAEHVRRGAIKLVDETAEPEPAEDKDYVRAVVRVDELARPVRVTEPKVASAAVVLAHRMENAARLHRVVKTSMVPTNHIAPLRAFRSGDAGGIGRLLCGRLMGGPLSPLDLDNVDCLGCLDAYVAGLAGRSPDPHRPADPPAEVRSPLIAP